jgi:hypothetical protein
MNSENDTFEKLKKISYEEMKRKYIDFDLRENRNYTMDDYVDLLMEFFKKNGWTLEEFSVEMKNRETKITSLT